jgi:AAA domain
VSRSWSCIRGQLRESASLSLDNLVRESEAVRVHLATLTIVHDRFPTRGAYPFHLPLFQQTTTVPVDAPVTLFVGENGSGKSTLLTAIARRADTHIWENRERSRSFDGASAQPVAFEDTDHLRFYRDFFASLAHRRRAAPAE